MKRFLSIIMIILLSPLFLYAMVQDDLDGHQVVYQAKVNDTEMILSYKKSGETHNSFWPDTDLRDSFLRYWSLRFDKNALDKLWELEAPHVPALVRKGNYAAYKKMGEGNRIEKIDLVSINKKTDYLYTVLVRLHFRFPGGDTKDTSLIDRWVKVRGEWYHDLREDILLPNLK